MAKKKKQESEELSVIEIFSGEHFCVWGNKTFITINFHFNDVSLTMPTLLWNEMRSDFQIIGLIPAPGSNSNGSVPNNVDLN